MTDSTVADRSRQAIIEAAGAQFAAFGYEATSFSRVAQAMGRPKSAIGYHQFPSKASLATAVVEQQQQRWVRIEAQIPRESHLEYLTTLLLTTSLDARSCSVAAGAIRLLRESKSEDFVPQGAFNWLDVTARELRACIVESGADLHLLPARAERLVLDSTYGLLGASSALPDDDYVPHLKALWIPLFTSFGVVDAEASIRHFKPIPAPLDGAR